MTDLVRVVCGARLRGKQGRTCQQSPLLGRERCKFHGGATPRGTDSPHWQGKGYSKDLPTALADRVKVIRQFNDLTSTVDELELIVARVGEQLNDLETLDGTAIIDELMDIAHLLREARGADKPDTAIDAAIDRIASLIGDATHVKKTWRSIFEAVELKRKLVETQIKRDILDSTTMTGAQALTFVAEVKMAALEEIKDEQDRARFMLRVQARMGEAVSSRQLPDRRKDADGV
jgi:hypothetical protein